MATGPFIYDLPDFATSPELANAGLRDMAAAERVKVKAAKTQWAAAGASTRVWDINLDAVGSFRPPPDKLGRLLSLTAAALSRRGLHLGRGR